jgi:uncharacterized protein YutE (UPF0331/DUF86 family)
MDRDLVRAKQDSIVRCIERIRTKSEMSYADLLADYDAQDVVVLNLERAVQQAVDIALHLLADGQAPVPGSMREAFVELEQIGALCPEVAERMRRAVGFRNTAVQAYQKIEWAIVHAMITKHLTDFVDFLRDIDRHLDGDGDGAGGG